MTPVHPTDQPDLILLDYRRLAQDRQNWEITKGRLYGCLHSQFDVSLFVGRLLKVCMAKERSALSHTA